MKKAYKRYFCKALLALAGVIALQGCIKEHVTKIGAGDGEVRVRLEVDINGGVNHAATRGMSETNENTISTIDIYHFVKQSNGKYLGMSHEPVQGTFTQGPPSWVNATLNTFPGKNSKLVVVVNARKTGNYGYAYAIEIDTFLAALIVEEAGEWYNSTARPLPMYAITKDVEVKKETTDITDSGSAFALIRMHAKFNIRLKQPLDLGTFELASLCIFNRSDKGYIPFDGAKLNMTNPTAPFATAPHVPASRAPKYLPGLAEPYYTVGTNSTKPDYKKIVNKQYVFETNNASQTDRLKKTALVIGGKYGSDTKVTYYRVDIDVTGGNILRNHLYDVEIQWVKSSGYITAEDAFIGGSSLSAKITPWNLTAQNTIIDGSHILTVSEDEHEFEGKGGEITISAETNYNITTQGYTAGLQIDQSEIVYLPGVSPGNEWLTFTDITGANGSFVREFKITTSINSAADRTAKVMVKAGNMTKVINITQTYTRLELGSNCYMVKGADIDIEIPTRQVAIAMGWNDKPNEQTATLGYLGMNWITTAEYASAKLKVDVLWTDLNVKSYTNGAVVKALSYDGTKHISEGTITVTPGTGIGNTVICLYYDANSNDKYDTGEVIKWSWHIWSADGYYPYNALGKPVGIGTNNAWMDRNLGATGNSSADGVKALGLMYQWGRKDPFMGSTTTSGKIIKPIYNATGTELTLLAWVKGYALTNSILNPLRMVSDWNGSISISDSNDDSWGNANAVKNAKKVFDPCPDGYRVPTYIGKTPSWQGVTAQSFTAGTGTTWENWGGYYPTPGYRTTSGIDYVGTNGFYWSGTSIGFTSSYLTFSNNIAWPSTLHNRTWGYSVRCMAD